VGIKATARVTMADAEGPFCAVCGYPATQASGRGSELCGPCLYLALFRERYSLDPRFMPRGVRNRTVEVPAGHPARVYGTPAACT
jgi:hypothetical protein